jgi:hypothetical protein
MKEAGAYVLEVRYDYASGATARNLAEEVFEEMFAVWFEAHSENDDRAASAPNILIFLIGSCP